MGIPRILLAPCEERMDGNQNELCIAVLVACLGVPSAFAQKTTPRFKVIAFYTGKADARTSAS